MERSTHAGDAVPGRDVGYAWLSHRSGEGRRDVGTDRVTKVLLGAIAAGVWVLVLLQVANARTASDIAAEVRAIGADTQSIHEDMDADASAQDDVEGGATSYRRN